MSSCPCWSIRFRFLGRRRWTWSYPSSCSHVPIARSERGWKMGTRHPLHTTGLAWEKNPLTSMRSLSFGSTKRNSAIAPCGHWSIGRVVVRRTSERFRFTSGCLSDDWSGAIGYPHHDGEGRRQLVINEESVETSQEKTKCPCSF